jgi:hypothetical protein
MRWVNVPRCPPLGWRTLNLRNLALRQFPPLAGREVSQIQRPDRNPNESDRRMSHRGRHAPNLPVQPLSQRDPQPGGRHGFAKPNRHRTIRKLRRGRQHAHLGRLRASPLEQDALSQPTQCFVVREALHLSQIDLRELMLRVGNAMGQRAIRGQHHESFAILIQSAGGIDAGDRHKISQGRSSRRIGKAGKDPIGLIEDERARPRLYRP